MSVVTADLRANYHRQVKTALENARQNVAKFAAELVENPVHALEWSDSVYTYGAQVALFQRVDQALENPEVTLQHVYDTVQSELFSMARYINNRSTGQGKNRLQDCKVTVWANEVDQLRRMMRLERI